MDLWYVYISFLQAVLFVLSHAFGGNLGLAIIALTMMVRLLLLPMTLKLSRRAIVQQRLLQKIQPQLQLLRKKYAHDPKRLTQESTRVFKSYGVHPVDGHGIMGVLLQLPIVLGLFAAVKRAVRSGGRFLWIADIAKPDFLLTMIVAILTYVSMIISPNPLAHSKIFYLLLPALATLFFLSKAAAGIGLYWAAYNAIGVFEKIILRYGLKRWPIEARA